MRIMHRKGELKKIHLKVQKQYHGRSYHRKLETFILFTLALDAGLIIKIVALKSIKSNLLLTLDEDGEV